MNDKSPLPLFSHKGTKDTKGNFHDIDMERLREIHKKILLILPKKLCDLCAFV